MKYSYDLNHSLIKIRALLLISFGLLFGLLVAPVSATSISLEQNQPISLSGKIEYLEDVNHLLTSDDILDNIAQNPKASDTPLIAVTADVTKECHLACKQSGMNQVLNKPLSIQPLKEPTLMLYSNASISILRNVLIQ